MASRRCPGRYCPTILTGGERYCPTHEAEYEGKRGTSKERGYDADYRAERRRAAVVVASGVAECWRCGRAIKADEPFDLGHDDDDRTIIRGPEHRFCNRSAAGKASHRY